MNTRSGSVRFTIVLALLAAVSAGAAHAQGASPKIFDWGLRDHNDPAAPEVIPVPWNDQWSYWSDWGNTYSTLQFNAGKPVSTLLRGMPDAPAINMVSSGNGGVVTAYYSDGYIEKYSNGVRTNYYYDQAEANAGLAQWTGAERNALSQTMNYLSSTLGRMDYVFMDIEDVSHLSAGEPVQDVNVRAAVAQVRAHANPYVNTARIGNYAEYPGATDMSALSPSRTDRTNWWVGQVALGIQSDRNAFYLNSGLNVAMPDLYPYSFYIAHSRTDGGWGWTNYPTAGQNFYSPNDRAALFWAPLEHFSTAARALPAGHELIPWVTDYLHWNGYDLNPGQTPTVADNTASIQHYRLRGANGLYLWSSSVMSESAYRQLVSSAWHSLDTVFNRSGAQRSLNLATNKTGGYEWSAAEKGNRVLAVVSNLDTNAHTVDWSRNLQFPMQSPSVAANTHTMLRYRSSYLDNDNLEKYTASQPMNNQGAASWKGSTPGNFTASTPPGSGNVTARAVNSGPAYTLYEAWNSAPNPGFTATDKVVYSAWLYRESSSIGFIPTNTASGTATSQPGWNHHGLMVQINWDKFKIAPNRDTGTVYEAVNLAAAASKWYEVKVEVDPTKDIDGVSGGDHGAAAVWVRNVTDGQTDFTRLVFDLATTPGVVERLWEIPLQLNAAASRDLPDLNGYIIRAYGANNSIDNLNAGYYVPHYEDNFDHYDLAAADVSGVQGWLSGQASFHVQASSGTGNGSSPTLTPVAGASGVVGRWRTEPAGFDASDKVIFQGRLNGGNAGGSAAPVGFSLFNTTQTWGYGPYASIYWNEFRFRATRINGPSYKATNLTPSPSQWYEFRIVIDPTRDIDGTAGGNYGVATVFLRNLTAGQTTFTQLVFDDIGTTGTVEQLTEIPLWLTPDANPTNFDGWEIYGYGPGVQIDALTAILSPN